MLDNQQNTISDDRNYVFVVILHTAAAAKSPQSCPTLCDPIDGSIEKEIKDIGKKVSQVHLNKCFSMRICCCCLVAK